MHGRPHQLQKRDRDILAVGSSDCRDGAPAGFLDTEVEDRPELPKKLFIYRNLTQHSCVELQSL